MPTVVDSKLVSQVSDEVLLSGGASTLPTGQAPPHDGGSPIRFEARCGALLEFLAPVAEIAKHVRGNLDDDTGLLCLRAESQGLLAWAAHGGTLVHRVLSATSASAMGYRCIVEGLVTINAKEMAATLHSFGPSEMLVAQCEYGRCGWELVFRPREDLDQLQGVLCRDNQAFAPEALTTYGKSVVIRRDALIHGISKTIGAANKNSRPSFQNLAFRVRGGKARFCAGDGGRFAWMEIGGNDLFEAVSPDQDIFIPITISKHLKKVLTLMTDKYVVIAVSETGDRILVRAGDVNIVLAGLDPTLSWPDESVVVDARPGWQVVVSAADFNLMTAGMYATTQAIAWETREIVPVKVTVDGIAKTLKATVKAENAYASRSASLLGTEGDVGNTSFLIDPRSLIDVAKAAGRRGNIQIAWVNHKVDKPAVIVAWIHGDQIVRPASALAQPIKKLGLMESRCVFFGQRGDSGTAGQAAEQKTVASSLDQKQDQPKRRTASTPRRKLRAYGIPDLGVAVGIGDSKCVSDLTEQESWKRTIRCPHCGKTARLMLAVRDWFFRNHNFRPNDPTSTVNVGAGLCKQSILGHDCMAIAVYGCSHCQEATARWNCA